MWNPWALSAFWVGFALAAARLGCADFPAVGRADREIWLFA
ncbi:MAG: hypothetical protein WCA10_05470 [Terracidiphilus sp.]